MTPSLLTISSGLGPFAGRNLQYDLRPAPLSEKCIFTNPWRSLVTLSLNDCGDSLKRTLQGFGERGSDPHPRRLLPMAVSSTKSLPLELGRALGNLGEESRCIWRRTAVNMISFMFSQTSGFGIPCQLAMGG